MATADVVSGGYSCSVRWQDEADPQLRRLVVKQLEATMTGLCRAMHRDRSPPEDLNQYVADFEEKTFQTAKDMIDYMKLISIRVSFGQKEAAQLKAKAAAGRQQKMQMVRQMQRANMVQPIQGVTNSLLTTTPQAVSMKVTSWPSFQTPNQHTPSSVASNMDSNVNQVPSDMMAMLYQKFNSEPAIVVPVAPGLQSSQQIMQSIAMQTESQSPPLQLQPTTNIAQCHTASTVQLQGQQIARPKRHLNQHLLPALQQEHFSITQQQVGMHMQRYQMHGANVGKINTGYSGGWNNQQSVGWASGLQSKSKVCRQTNMESHPSPAQSQITVDQQSNLHCPLPPQESISQMRENIVITLDEQKSHSNQSQGVTSPCSSYKSPGELQSSLNSNDVELSCTSSSPISKFWIGSPIESPKSRSQSPIAKQGHVAALSPFVSVKFALTSAEKTGIEVAASPSTLVKPVSPSAIVKSGTVPAAIPSDKDLSFLPHNNGVVNGCKQATATELSMPVPPAEAADQKHGRPETPVPKTPVPPGDQAEDQEHGAAEKPAAKTPAPPADEAEDQKHGGNERPVAKTPAPSDDQAKDQEHGGVETSAAQKPMDRLISAVVSSSPAMIHSSVNLMKSAIIDMDSVASPIESDNKMKRAYAVTSTSESPTLSSTDDSTVTCEFNVSDAASSSGYHSGKRQKVQNVKDALLDEVQAVNSRLIDTSISITSENDADGITSCNGTTLIKLSYTAVSLAPGLKSRFEVLGNCQPLVMPTTLSVPADYPRSSPVIIDDARKKDKFSSISVAADRAFRLTLHNLEEPRSLKEIAVVWDSCVRCAVTEYISTSCVVGTDSSPCLFQGWVKG